MQIDKLQIELRPRSNAQALDLGFALLRSHASAAYMAFLALWLPLLAVSAVLTWFFPKLGWAWLLLAWWFKPVIERAPLYVLSRQVFGTAVTWQEAVRAWPRQLGGGTWRLLTWGRPFAAGRALYQAVWMLEGARGKVARARMAVLGRDRTAQSAFWFGIVCVHLEGVLQIGAYGLIGLFVSDSSLSNPFALFLTAARDTGPALALLSLTVYGVCSALVAPIYTACGFTLYLNRRATLEAWDLELKLRQIKAPVSAKAKSSAGVVSAALLAVLVAMLPAPSEAAEAQKPAPTKAAAAPDSRCEALPEDKPSARGDHHDASQARIRAQVDSVYASEDLRGFQCKESWFRKHKDDDKKDKKKKQTTDAPVLGLVASLLKALLIAAAVGLVAWLLYRYRDKLPRFARSRQVAAATEVGGLDIRAESLPDDVSASVRALWDQGQRRAALGLLYRATLSRLVTEDGLLLRQGDTEGDCLRLCRQACLKGKVSQGRLDVTAAATTLWMDAAYGDRWPALAQVLERCRDWDDQFASHKVAP